MLTETRTEARPRGDMKSIAREHGFLPLRVEGRVPAELEGTLVRTGPGLYERFGARVGHSFEADGALSAVRLRAGQAEGSIRLCRSEGMLAEDRAGRSLFGPRAHPLRRIANSLRGRTKNTGNTAVLAWQDRLFALVESNKPLEISAEDLSTIGETDLDGAITSAFSAHPHRVIARKATYNFGLKYGRTTSLVLYELPWEGRARQLFSLPLPKPVMLHDFAVGPRYAVFFVSPVEINLPRAVFGMTSFGSILEWKPSKGVEVIVVPLDAPERVVRWTTPAFYQWHFAGVRERGHELVVHYVRHADFGSFEQLAGSGITRRGTLHEAVIDPIARTLRSEPVSDAASEFPVVDPRFEGCGYRDVFLASEHQERSALARLDLSSRRTRLAVLSESERASEVVFVPRAPSAPEGDGWALSLVYDEARDASHLAIFDTARWEQGPVARCHFETHVPMTFHGTWLPRRASP
jgi:all-trans-8'-apo-beta-carotenal 15,15'-oxygenase